MVLTNEITSLLVKLAGEDKTSPEKFLEKLLIKEDGDRHMHWSRKKGRFVKYKCGRSACFEERAKSPEDE